MTYDIALVLALCASVIVLVVVLIPFVWPLKDASDEILHGTRVVDSLPLLYATKDALIERYCQDERLYQEKQISKLVWEQRRQHLIGRYCDAARRADFLEGTQDHVEEEAAKNE